jgi:transposase
MLGPSKPRHLDHLVTVSLESLVPADHFYRQLEVMLDLSFVRDWVKDCYALNGRPSIDPVVFFKLQLALFFEGLRSERQLMRVAADHLSIRWYAGYNLDEPLPDHSSLTRIRQRLGLAVFRRFFDAVVERCQQAGLVWGKELLVDATKVQGNASSDSMVPRLKEVVDDHLIDLFSDEDEDEAVTEQPEPAPPLLRPPSPTTSAGNETDTGMEVKRWDVLETCRLDPDRPLSQGYERISNRKVSRTDPDATPITMADGRSALGYQTHYMIDGGKARIILHALTMSGDVMENQPFLDQLRRVLFRWKLHPDRIIADTKYSTIENIKALDAMGITAYIPLRDWESKTEYFGGSHFTYDPDQDVYRCPDGAVLASSRIEWKAEKTEYRAEPAVCNACALKARCTPSDQGRQLHRSFHAAAMEKVKGYEETEAYKKALRKRKVWIEPLFAEAKQWHGLARFRLRRLWRVNIQTLVIAAGQNLKRYLAATGWGRRHGPTGSLWASFQPDRPSRSRL